MAVNDCRKNILLFHLAAAVAFAIRRIHVINGTSYALKSYHALLCM